MVKGCSHPWVVHLPVRIVVLRTSEKPFVQMYRTLPSEPDDHSGLTVKLSTNGTDRSSQTRIRTEKKKYLGQPAKRQNSPRPCMMCRIHDIILLIIIPALLLALVGIRLIVR